MHMRQESRAENVCPDTQWGPRGVAEGRTVDVERVVERRAAQVHFLPVPTDTSTREETGTPKRACRRPPVEKMHLRQP